MKLRILIAEKSNGDCFLAVELKDGGFLDINELINAGRYDVSYGCEEHNVIMEDTTDF